MSGSRWIISVGIGALSLAGCNKGSTPSHAQQTTPPAVATTQPAEQASAIIAPHPAPVAAHREDRSFTLTESGIQRPYSFPSARLHIDKEQKTAVLYTDDPKIAINSNYDGNSYYMVIPLTDDVLDHLDGYQWHFKAGSSERQDSADGIFLEGQRYHLQPMDVLVVFKGDGPKLQVGVGGEFFKFDMTQTQHDASLVSVSAIVNATVDAVK